MPTANDAPLGLQAIEFTSAKLTDCIRLSDVPFHEYIPRSLLPLAEPTAKYVP